MFRDVLTRRCKAEKNKSLCKPLASNWHCTYASATQRALSSHGVTLQRVMVYSRDCHMESTSSFVRCCCSRAKVPRSLAACASLSASLIAFRFPTRSATGELQLAERAPRPGSGAGNCQSRLGFRGGCAHDTSRTSDLHLPRRPSASALTMQ